MNNITKHKIVKINNNKRCVLFSDVDNIIQIVQMQVCAFKKIIGILENFLILLDKLNEKTFSAVNNVSSTKDVLEDAIQSLYNTIIMALTSRFHDIQLLNVSNCSTTVKGYKLKHVEDEIITKNISLFLNSMRIQYYDIGIIKIVENDARNLPRKIMFIGTDFSELEEENFYEILHKCKTNVLETIRLFKITEMKHIQISNNLQNIK